MRVVGLTNSATYEAYAFLNVINILEGNGALPISPITLLPVGDILPTIWHGRSSSIRRDRLILMKRMF